MIFVFAQLIIFIFFAVFITVIFILMIFLILTQSKEKQKLSERDELNLNEYLKKVPLVKCNTLKNVFNLEFMDFVKYSLGFLQGICGFYNQEGQLIGIGYLRLQGGFFYNNLNGTFLYYDYFNEIKAKIRAGIVEISIDNHKVLNINFPNQKIYNLHGQIVAELQMTPLIPHVSFVNIYHRVVQNNNIICETYAARHDIKAFQVQMRALVTPSVYNKLFSNFWTFTLNNEKIESITKNILLNKEIALRGKLPLFTDKHHNKVDQPLAAACIFLGTLSYAISRTH